MARQRGVIQLRGTFGGITFVESKAYGAHSRAARGTYKKAKINDVLKSNANNSRNVTSFGSPVLRELKALEKGFAAGELWSRITGRLFRAKSMKAEDLLESLTGVEVNERYPFTKLFSALPGFGFSFQKSRLMIEMEVLSQPVFSKEVKASGYLCEVTVLFLDGKGGCSSDKMETEWISFKDDLGIYQFEYEKPKGARYFLVVAGVKGGKDEREIESFAARGYRVCGWGKI